MVDGDVLRKNWSTVLRLTWPHNWASGVVPLANREIDERSGTVQVRAERLA
jgi:hypothetical protein